MVFIPIKWIPWILLIGGIIMMVFSEGDDGAIIGGIVCAAIGGIWLFLAKSGNNGNHIENTYTLPPQQPPVQPPRQTTVQPPIQPPVQPPVSPPQAQGELKFCTQCGSKNAGNAVFCLKCGNAFNGG